MRKSRLCLCFFLTIGMILLTGSLWAKGGSEPVDPEKKTVLMTAGEYTESPMLAERVAAGELPPVAERLPKDPAVLEPVEMIGKHGGTFNVFGTSAMPWNDLASENGATLLRISPDGSTTEGNILKSYEMSADGKAYTLYLRDGAKWSDGQPFVPEDIMFQFEDILWDGNVTGTWNRLPLITRLEKLDDLTLRIEADVPYYTAEMIMAPAEGIGWRYFKPKHYFQKWHPKYNPDAEAVAKDEGYDNWYEALSYHVNWAPQNDLEVPTMAPWVIQEQSTTLRIWERNPYYWKVDTAGNQLPYLDKVVSSVVDTEIYQLKIISGESDAAWTRTNFSNFPLYKKNAESAGYNIVSMVSPVASVPVFKFNLNDPDPFRNKLYNDVRFRQAMSVAINRDEINEAVYFNLGVPGQVTCLPTTSFYKEEWGEAYAQYDPDLAGRLLDEVGLKQKNADGLRLGPDGDPFQLIIEIGANTSTPIEMVKEYWEAVGIKVLIKNMEGSLLTTRQRSIEHNVLATAIDDINEPALWSYTANRWSVPAVGAWNWGLWMQAQKDINLGRKTLTDFEGGVLPGEEPPEEIQQLDEWIERWTSVPYMSDEYKEIGTKIFDFHAEKLYYIGTVGMAPYIYIAKKNVGNIPSGAWANFSWTGSPNMVGEQLFFKD